MALYHQDKFYQSHEMLQRVYEEEKKIYKDQINSSLIDCKEKIGILQAKLGFFKKAQISFQEVYEYRKNSKEVSKNKLSQILVLLSSMLIIYGK